MKSVSGNPRLELVCECGFAFKTSGLPAHCPSCGKVHTSELCEYCPKCNSAHTKDTLQGKNWIAYILAERSKRRHR